MSPCSLAAGLFSLGWFSQSFCLSSPSALWLVAAPFTGLLAAGGDEQIRTVDPLLAKQVLSQLSYTPIFSKGRALALSSSLPFRRSTLLFLKVQIEFKSPLNPEEPKVLLNDCNSKRFGALASVLGPFKIKQRVERRITVPDLESLPLFG